MWYLSFGFNSSLVTLKEIWCKSSSCVIVHVVCYALIMFILKKKKCFTLVVGFPSGFLVGHYIWYQSPCFNTGYFGFVVSPFALTFCVGLMV